MARKSKQKKSAAAVAETAAASTSQQPDDAAASSSAGSNDGRSAAWRPPAALLDALGATKVVPDWPLFRISQWTGVDVTVDVSPTVVACSKCQSCASRVRELAEDVIAGEVGTAGSDIVKPLVEMLLSMLDEILSSGRRIIVSHGYSDEVALRALVHLGFMYGFWMPNSCIVDDALVLIRSGVVIEDQYKSEEMEDALMEMEMFVIAEAVVVLSYLVDAFTLADCLWCFLICGMDATMFLAHGIAKITPRDKAPTYFSSPFCFTTISMMQGMVFDGDCWNGEDNMPYYLQMEGTSVEYKGTFHLPEMWKKTMHEEYYFIREVIDIENHHKEVNDFIREVIDIENDNKEINDFSQEVFDIENDHKEISEFVQEVFDIENDHKEINFGPSLPTLDFSDASIKPVPQLSCPASKRKESMALMFTVLPAASRWFYNFKEGGVGTSILYVKSSHKAHCLAENELLREKLAKHMDDLHQELSCWFHCMNCMVVQSMKWTAKEQTEIKLLQKLDDKGKNLEEVYNEKKLDAKEMETEQVTKKYAKLNASILSLQDENVNLKVEMQAIKTQQAELTARHSELLKIPCVLPKLQSLEDKKIAVQGQLAAANGKLSKLQILVKQARGHLNELQIASGHLRVATRKVLARANAERQECLSIITSVEQCRKALLGHAEDEVQKFRNYINFLHEQISYYCMLTEPSAMKKLELLVDETCTLGNPQFTDKVKGSTVSCESGNDCIERERECVMCLSEEASVVFLPCAHSVLCGECNRLHEKQGMENCPYCRSPVLQRVANRPVNW